MRKLGKQNPELNLFGEMRQLAATDKTITSLEIVRMATVNGARALGLAGKAGELSRNTFADLITIPFAGKITDACEAILNHTGNVNASMIGGRWTIPPK
jgi:imidazolonepropionase-like amidohydrolase